jgi:hypothetical protein
MRLVLIALIIASAISLIAARYAVDPVTLTPEERKDVALTCAGCHSNVAHLDHDAGTSHRQHGNLTCVTCHASDEGLESADKYHDIIQWFGIGTVAATVSVLALNYSVAKRRLARGKTDEHQQDD